MRKTTLFTTAVLALTVAGWTAGARAQAADATAPAAEPSKSAPKMHHKAKAKAAPKAEAGDAAVEDLNAKSLDDAKAGKSFAPATATPADTAPAAKTDKAKKPMAHHKHKMKKPAADAAPAAADAPK